MFTSIRTGSITALKVFGGAVVTGAGLALGKGLMVTTLDGIGRGFEALSKKVKKSDATRKAEKAAAQATANVASSAA